jgi:hypothetical protein
VLSDLFEHLVWFRLHDVPSPAKFFFQFSQGEFQSKLGDNGQANSCKNCNPPLRDNKKVFRGVSLLTYTSARPIHKG